MRTRKNCEKMIVYFEKNPLKMGTFFCQNDPQKWLGILRPERNTPVQTKSEYPPPRPILCKCESNESFLFKDFETKIAFLIHCLWSGGANNNQLISFLFPLCVNKANLRVTSRFCLEILKQKLLDGVVQIAINLTSQSKYFGTNFLTTSKAIISDRQCPVE